MRTVQDTNSWCLRGPNHRSPCTPSLSQVCTMVWRRLRALLPLLRGDRIGPGSASRHSSCRPPRQLFAERIAPDCAGRGCLAGFKHGNVRSGSEADICSAQAHIRFAPESGHVRCASASQTTLAYAVSSKCFGLITSLLKFSEKVSEPRGH